MAKIIILQSHSDFWKNLEYCIEVFFHNTFFFQMRVGDLREERWGEVEKSQIASDLAKDHGEIPKTFVVLNEYLTKIFGSGPIYK